ncbi:apolipophorin-like [Mytilus galloprovincialis]|uniref:apolipophorin-like n=1 Tax=Mytilus galloprovincialis TaxID=29158 RepID=UPI003F7B8AE8
MSLQYYCEVLDFTQSQTTQLSNTIEGVYTKYGKQVTDSVASISSNKILESVRSRLPTIPMKQMADRYNTVIYNARESINTGLIKTLPTPVYHMASSAYKYWEIEENIRSVFIKFVNFIKKDIEDEFSNIKDLITDVKKTKVTVYDPKKGHFEMDIYLPLEMKSFTEVKRIANPIENLRSYIPQSNPLPSLGDIWSHAVIPSFGAHAYIKGDHFTTFDGQEYDFNGRCSYVLARDFGKDKFSIILNYMGRQSKKMVVMTSTQNVQVAPNGKVRVDGVESKLPYASNEIKISQVGDNIYVDGNGFGVVNNIKSASYDIELSHWFHGRTGGLLGVHDNERFDDMMMSNKQITSDANALATSWQVQEKCR